MKNSEKLWVGLFFFLAFLQILFDIFNQKDWAIILKPILPLFLLLIYFIYSKQKNVYFVFTLLLASFIYFIYQQAHPALFIFGLLAFTIQRILIIILLLIKTKIKDMIAFVIGAIPFLVLFFYLFFTSDEVQRDYYNLLLINNLLIAIMGGIALSNYVMEDIDSKSLWLLITVLFFAGTQLLFYIEKFFIDLQIFRPLSLALNYFGLFALYRFVRCSSNYINIDVP